MSSPEYGPFDNDTGRDIVGDITSSLEAELVSFVHRVKFAYAMNYESARAAAVLLTMFANNGLPWSPPEDAKAALIDKTFQTYFQTITKFPPELRRAVEEDIATFVKTFANRDVTPRSQGTQRVSDALRAVGTRPAAWRWGAAFAFDFVDAWMHSESPARCTAEMALAAGVSAKEVIRAIAKALLREVKAIKRSRLDVRDGLLKVLDRVATTGVISGRTRTSADQVVEASRTAGAAFLKQFHQHMAKSHLPMRPAPTDPLEEMMHQTAGFIQMCDSAAQHGMLDPHRAGDFIERLARDAKTDALGAIRSALQQPVLRLAKRRARQIQRNGLIVVGHDKTAIITAETSRHEPASRTSKRRGGT